MGKINADTFASDLIKALRENADAAKSDESRKINDLSIAFNEMLKDADSVASRLDQLGVSLSQVLFESDSEWIERLKKESPETFELYNEMAEHLARLNAAICNYEKLKAESDMGEIKKIILSKMSTEMFLDYIPDVKRQMRAILKPPENPEIKDIFDKIKNANHEFMAKAKYIVICLREIDPAIPSFDALYNS